MADITGLDRVGIPVVSCVRPFSSDDIWVYSGKGKSITQARVSAAMECAERVCALWNTSAAVLRSERELRANGASFWPPERFSESKCDGYSKTKRIYWVVAQTLPRLCPVLVPAELVFSGRAPPLRHRAFVVSTSNGLAAHYRRSSAIEHALLELVERHQVSHAEIESSHRGLASLLSVARAVGASKLDVAMNFVDDTRGAVAIEHKDLTETGRQFLSSFDRVGLNVSLSLLRNRLQIPVVAAACIERLDTRKYLATAGYAAHYSIGRAAEKALLELAQSRCTDRQGARDDCGRDEKGRLDHDPTSQHWLFLERKRRRPAWSDEFSTNRRGVRFVLDSLRSHGFPDVAIHRFAAPRGLTVVRAICPGLQTWHATAGASEVPW